MVSVPARAVIALALAAAAACDGASAGADPPGLVEAARAKADPIDAAKAAADPAELARALAAPHTAVAAALGAHRFTGSSRLTVSEGGAKVERLEQQTAIEYAGNGDFHGKLDNSRDYGREVTFAGGLLFIRPRWGKFHRRPPVEPAEPGQVRDDIYGDLGAYFELCAPAAELTDQGTIAVEGRNARKIGLQLAPSPRARPRETAAERTWRQDVAVTALTGEVLLDETTGAPLHATLAANLTFTREGRSFTMQLAVDHTLGAIGGAVAVTAPPETDTVATPLRSHEAEERETLLRGIAPPARPSPTPDNPEGEKK